MNEYWFYDTSSLLLDADNLFTEGHAPVIISTVTLDELEKLKTSNSKDIDTKIAAEHLIRKLKENIGKYTVWIFNVNMLDPIIDRDLEITADMKILGSALDYDKKVHPDETIFITNDLSLFNIANTFFGEDSIRMIEIQEDDYSGYKEVQLSERQMADFYENQSKNLFNLYTNEYLIIKNEAGEIVDRLCWTGSEHQPISFNNFDSVQFGQIRPMKGDIQQQLAFDSLLRNKITMLHGTAGTGKSLLALGFLFYCLEKGKIDKIIIFCNPVAARGAAKLGFTPGSLVDKILDTQVGNMLIAKLGDRIAIEQLIQQNKLVLLPFSNIRGYDTKGMKAGVYITEAQNLNVNLMKLALQRVGEDSIYIIDGDNKTQLDMDIYAGNNNGMRRLSQVFRGHNIYGEVELKTIHRSEISRIAEQM